jgi:hypothetical protein
MVQLKKTSHNHQKLILKLGVEIKRLRTKLEIKSQLIVAQLPIKQSFLRILQRLKLLPILSSVSGCHSLT